MEDKFKNEYKTAGSRIFIIFSLICIITFILIGCRIASAENSEPQKITRVSVILPHSDDGYWTLIQDGIEEAEEEIGKQYGIDINISIPQLNYNIEQMIDSLKQQIAAKVDIIVVQGNENEAFAEVLTKAREAGIKVICIDTPMREFQYDIYIGTDNRAAGRMMAEKLGELSDGRGTVAVISGEPGYLNLEERLEGFCEVLMEQYPDITIKGPEYTYYDGLTFMNLYHRLSAEVDMLACLEGTGGITLSHTYQETDETYRCITAFDSEIGVESGVLDGAIIQDTHGIGRRLIEEIAYYVENGRFESRNIYTDFFWIGDKESKEAPK